MEDQQPAAGDLTDDVRHDESQTDIAVATEPAETGQTEPKKSGPKHQMPRKRGLFKNWSISGPSRRRSRDHTVNAHQDSAGPDETDDAATEPGQDRDDAAPEPAQDRDDAAVQRAEDGEKAAAEPPDAGEEPATESTEDGDETASEAADPGEQPTRLRKPAGRRLAAAVLVAAALFVGSAAFAGAVMQPYLADRAVVATKLDIARTAANAITTLWSYTPENLDKLADRAATYLSGDFQAQYRKFVDALVAPNKQAQVTNSTQVTGAAVESLEGPTAVAIVYTNTTSTSPVTKNIPSLRYLSYRLFMKRDHARWRVTRMTTITSLDLTPRL